MTYSADDEASENRLMAAAWEKYYVPGMGTKEAKAFKAAWARAWFGAWYDGYAARIEGKSVTDGPPNPDAVSRPARRRRKLLKECSCLCHDLAGGSVHWGNRCVCNGGQGFDDGSDHERQVP